MMKMKIKKKKTDDKKEDKSDNKKEEQKDDKNKNIKEPEKTEQIKKEQENIKDNIFNYFPKLIKFFTIIVPIFL